MRILDGPVGTELAARGVPTPLPGWSVHAIAHAPEVLSAIHRDYALAGATIHTACTFRTRPRTAGPHWAHLAARAVRLCREAVPADHLVLGSLAPIEDCYRPDLAPPVAEAEAAHRALADVLADAGCDALLCETFASSEEALAAVRAARATGCETWLSLTAGPTGSLMDPAQMAAIAARAAELGATVILVNCTSASRTLPYVQALVAALPDLPIGAYANAGKPDERIGWQPGPPGPERYLEHVRHWVEAGATLVGGCCGTGPEHIRAIASAFR